MLIDLTIGRKGFLNYVKAIGGSNVIKVAPSNGSASESQADAKRNNHNFLHPGCSR